MSGIERDERKKIKRKPETAFLLDVLRCASDDKDSDFYKARNLVNISPKLA